MAVTLGLIELGTKILNNAIKLTMKLLGATEEQAIAVVANGWVQWAEAIGIGALTLKSKTPTIIAEKLGFTSKGFALRDSILGKAVGTKSATALKAVTTAEKLAVVAADAPAIAARTQTTFQKVNEVVGFVTKIVALPVGTLYMVAQWVDFGNWNSGAYQGTMQKLLAVFGLVPDVQYVKSKVLSGEMFTKIFAVYTNAGATFITNPQTGQQLPFNRENLITVADFVGSQIILEQGQVTTKELLGALTALTTLGTAGGPSLPLPASSVVGASVSTSNVKVFTGLVSQGTLGNGLSFVPREDDIIDSIEDLRDAVQNNLASFLMSLPSSIIYEVKVVPSVTTKDGFRQVGRSQQVVSGTNKDGSPKYRTLTNKFATLTLYVLTDRGVKSKVSTITIGPTDAVNFRPSQGALVDLERTIKESIFTSDIGEIQAITASQAIDVAPPVENSTGGQFSVPAGVLATWEDGTINFTGGTSLYGGGVQQGFAYNGKLYEVLIPPNRTGTPEDYARNHLVQLGVLMPKDAPAPDMARKGATATTLYDWYQANGQQLPSVANRAVLYQSYGLGQAGLYAGTAEQNTKLLAYLKTGTLSA